MRKQVSTNLRFILNFECEANDEMSSDEGAFGPPSGT